MNDDPADNIAGSGREREVREAIRRRAGGLEVGSGLDGVHRSIRRRRHRRRVGVATTAVVVVLLGAVAVEASITDPPALETAGPSATTVPATTSTTTASTSTTLPPWHIPPCEEDVVPEDRTPTAENPRPFPTYVPQFHFEGLPLTEAACQAELNGVTIRVWKYDGEEVAPEVAAGGAVNLVVIDGVIVEATFAPSAPTTTGSPGAPHPPSTTEAPSSTFDTTVSPETTVAPTTEPPPLPSLPPGPTYVPEYNFVGLTLADAEALAAQRSIVLRVWKVDGEEILPEEFGDGTVNIELADGVVGGAEWSPSP